MVLRGASRRKVRVTGADVSSVREIEPKSTGAALAKLAAKRIQAERTRQRQRAGGMEWGPEKLYRDADDRAGGCICGAL
jgi:hypothetical protein